MCVYVFMYVRVDMVNVCMCVRAYAICMFAHGRA